MTSSTTRPEGLVNLRSALRRERRVRLAPPPKLTVSEWADRYRYLSREASAEPGRWMTSRAPYQRGMMDACSDPLVETVVLMTSSQVGKTEVLNNIAGFFADQDPAPILVLQPTIEMGEAWSKDRLAPMIRDTPRLSRRFPDPKSRDSGNTLRHKVFPGGHITISGANSAASLASRPIRVVLADEVDRYPASAGTEGDPVTLAVRRTATFWNRKIVLTSTPTVKGFSRIEAAFNESDQRYYHVSCPDCGHMQRLVWANLKWESDPETVMYCCEGCGVLIDESQKHAMLAGGVWVASEPGRRIAGFHISALYSPWAKWAELVREFLEVKAQPERLKVWVNTILGETWEEEGERVDAHVLASRREPHANETRDSGWGVDPHVVPVGVGVLTAAVDVQGDRLELKVKGYGAGMESWLIAHEQLWGDPSRDEVWRTLEQWRTRAWQHANGATMSIAATTIDTGGHHAEQVYAYARGKPNTWPIKGASEGGRPVWGRPSKPNKHGTRLVPVGTDTAKDLIFARMRIRDPGPGYMHIPKWADDEYLEQLTSEKVVTRYVKSRPVRRYEKTRPRNEALDLEVYALAALFSLGATVVESLGVWAASIAAEAVEKPEPEPERQPSRPRGSTWVQGWR